MPQSIPKGLERERLLQALADMNAGVEHPFGPPTGQELVQDDKRYPPKAVVGLAYLHLAGRILMPEEFSDGEAPGQTNFVLREFGFTVERKNTRSVLDSTEEVSERGRPWPRNEVEFIVANYFILFLAELTQHPEMLTLFKKSI